MTNEKFATLTQDILRQFEKHPDKQLTPGNIIILLNNRGYSDDEILLAFYHLKDHGQIQVELIKNVPHATRFIKNNLAPAKFDVDNAILELKLYLTTKIDQFFDYHFRSLKEDNNTVWAKRLQELRTSFTSKEVVETAYQENVVELKKKIDILETELAQLQPVPTHIV